MFELKLVGGTVVDGTGAPGYLADVGIKDGRIVEVMRRTATDPGLPGEASETIDAAGRVLAPGFVDIHTLYHGQGSWDSMLEPSSQHGLTTAVAANRGARLAPHRPGRDDYL